MNALATPLPAPPKRLTPLQNNQITDFTDIGIMPRTTVK